MDLHTRKAFAAHLRTWAPGSRVILGGVVTQVADADGSRVILVDDGTGAVRVRAAHEPEAPGPAAVGAFVRAVCVVRGCMEAEVPADASASAISVVQQPDAASQWALEVIDAALALEQRGRVPLLGR